MRVLVTGGAGFIGSHTCVQLAYRGHDVLIYDNFCNSREDVVDRLAQICGSPISCVRGDVRDTEMMRGLMAAERIEAVVHFAALKAVGESCEHPLRYFDNNVAGTLSLLQAMDAAGVGRLVFSSSATVYGSPDVCPIPESAPTAPTNPYGRSKLIAEQVIADVVGASRTLSAGVLRYFNPAGAHPTGLIGEDPAGIPNNLMPFVAQVATGQRERLQILGGDYPTRDGTGIRDYIHIMDLADAHVAALERLAGNSASFTVNLGSGQGYSVLEVVSAFERASGRTIPFEIVDRRSGDVAACYADPSLARELLGWRTKLDLDDICADAWRWQSQLTGA